MKQCNCSVCRRYGTLWAYYRRSAVSISAPRGALEDYARRAGGLRFVRCRSCGCVICWDGRGKARDRRMGINMRLFDHALMAAVPVKVLDGDQTWRVLGAYAKSGDVDLASSRAGAAASPASNVEALIWTTVDHAADASSAASFTQGATVIGIHANVFAALLEPADPGCILVNR